MIKTFNKKQPGFTLVELLVVIAIIGLLSSIVLVSFGPIRNSAKDVTIKGNITQMRLIMEMQYAENSNYLPANSRGDFQAANNAAKEAAGNTDLKVGISATAYCISGDLQSVNAGKWCVDSTGYAGNKNCVVANFKCE